MRQSLVINVTRALEMENKNSLAILIVEDEPDMADLVCALLQRQGYQVRAARTGTEGIQLAQQPDVALVLLDVMLPDVNGFDACLKIKENRPTLPIIMLTVRDQPIDIVTGLDSGADDYITKPFTSSVLLARVRAALRASQWRDAATRPAMVSEADAQRYAPELLSLISHELRTPVAAIKGFITTLLSNHRYWDDDEREAFLESVNQSADQLSRLVENVLEMGRLDKGVQLHKRPVRLASLVQRVFYDLGFRTGHCEFVNEVSADLPLLAIDPLKIERVLHNLVENAIKFSIQRGRIRVFARVTEQNIEIGVEDQGIGIAPEHLPHIFKPFYQVEQKDVPHEGVGLGLSIVKELIGAHGGRVWAESQPGKGSTVYFSLPGKEETIRIQPDYAAPLPPLAVSIPEHPAGKRHKLNGSATVLVVEDDMQLLRALRTYLSAQGLEILTTTRGSTAVEIVETTRPDLVLLDLCLPDVDGLTVCEQIRCFSNIPIIIITGQTADHHKVRGLALGADDYLVKPFSNQELLARVRAVLRRARISNGVERPQPLKFQGLEIDPTCYAVKTLKGSTDLTPTEHKLLFYLASNAGQVLTHQQILAQVWGYECDEQTQYLWVNISRLRKKIEQDPGQPHYILTEPGIGYRFAEPVEAI